MVDPRGAQIELPADYESQPASSPDGCAQRLLGRHGLLPAGDMSLQEYTIKPGDDLFVLGELCENRGLTSLRDAADEPLPRPGEGYLSAEAASLQRAEMLEAMGVTPSASPAGTTVIAANFDLHPPAVVALGDSDEPFVLARRQPQRMVQDLARRATRAIWGGSLLVLLSLALMLKGLNVW